MPNIDMSKRTTDIGPPHYEKFLPPIIKANYGTWKYHEIVKPGVLVHVGESGDKFFFRPRRHPASDER
jgi:dissimilatory sulfite reductase beta subunit